MRKCDATPHPKSHVEMGCGIVHENSFGIDFDMDFGV